MKGGGTDATSFPGLFPFFKFKKGKKSWERGWNRRANKESRSKTSSSYLSSVLLFSDVRVMNFALCYFRFRGKALKNVSAFLKNILNKLPSVSVKVYAIVNAT